MNIMFRDGEVPSLDCEPWSRHLIVRNIGASCSGHLCLISSSGCFFWLLGLVMLRVSIPIIPSTHIHLVIPSPAFSYNSHLHFPYCTSSLVGRIAFLCAIICLIHLSSTSLLTVDVDYSIALIFFPQLLWRYLYPIPCSLLCSHAILQVFPYFPHPSYSISNGSNFLS